MAKTALADIIVPTVFEAYAIERTAELSRFGESGIVEMAPEFDALAGGGGHEVRMPFWKDLTAARQIISDSAPLTVNKITTDQDIARIHNDANSWGVNHLAKVVAGDDPMAAIGELVGAYWARQDELLIISCLKGIFGAASMAGNLLAIHSETVAGTTAATKLNGSTFVDACAKLGDAADRLTAVAMHSATEAALRKLDLIDFLPDSEGKPVLRTFQGRRVVVDDTLPTRAGTTDGTVYTTYLFGQGAFAKGAAPLDGTPLEGGTGTEGVETAGKRMTSRRCNGLVSVVRIRIRVCRLLYCCSLADRTWTATLFLRMWWMQHARWRGSCWLLTGPLPPQVKESTATIRRTWSAAVSVTFRTSPTTRAIRARSFLTSHKQCACLASKLMWERYPPTPPF